MSEEEFFNRAINRICKDYDYNFANEFKLLFLKREKELERLNNIIKQQNTRNSRQRIANRKLLERNQDLVIENLKLNNIINKIEEHFVFLKMNSTGGNKEFFEDILVFIKALKELKGSEKE